MHRSQQQGCNRTECLFTRDAFTSTACTRVDVAYTAPGHPASAVDARMLRQDFRTMLTRVIFYPSDCDVTTNVATSVGTPPRYRCVGYGPARLSFQARSFRHHCVFTTPDPYVSINACARATGERNQRQWRRKIMYCYASRMFVFVT